MFLHFVCNLLSIAAISFVFIGFEYQLKNCPYFGKFFLKTVIAQ